MNTWARLWFSALQQAAEIGWYAPIVVGKRLRRFADAGLQPSAADRREWIRMLTEKNAAALESTTLFWAALATAPLRVQGVTRKRKAARRLVQSLRPVSRRVKANARRLARQG